MRISSVLAFCFFFSSRRRHTRWTGDWSSDVCSSDLGATRWVYNPKSYEAGTTTMSARWNQRGVAYWTDGKEERIFWGTGDGYLIAVDAKTGRPCDDFGQHGRVDLMDGLPRAKRGARDFLNALTYSVQSPPFVVRDVIITPASISSYVINKEQIPGWLRGFDARTG